MCSRFLFLSILLLLVVLPAAASPALAQGRDGRTAAQAHMTRAELQDVLDRYEQMTATPAQNDEMRMRARYEASLIRVRLEEGDFQIGDRIVMRVANEPALTDTFVVNRARALELPQIGEIPLLGVLRSELEDHLTEQLSRHIRSPIVRVSTMIRLQIMGSIARPGFFMVPSEMLLTDALMEAGGPDRDANITRIRIERGRDEIWSGGALQQAIIEGRTLDQLNLQAGDRILVPQRQVFTWREAIGVVGALASVFYLIDRFR